MPSLAGPHDARTIKILQTSDPLCNCNGRILSETVTGGIHLGRVRKLIVKTVIHYYLDSLAPAAPNVWVSRTSP